MRQKIKLGMTLLLLIAIIFLSRRLSQVVMSDNVTIKKEIIVVDPGHGGADPGKVGKNGILEKDVNLQIAKKVKTKLEACGFEVYMTREDDTVEEGQLNELKRRVAYIENLNPVLVVSIHQNSYTDESVRGAQVFYYSESEEGREAAAVVQQELIELNPECARSIKANSDFYLLKKVGAPMIIVECGFLSNEEDSHNLTLNEYQEEMAWSICTGITKWLD